MKIGILGSGVVGKALAAGFIKHGYDVMAGSQQPEKLDEWEDEVGDALVHTGVSGKPLDSCLPVVEIITN